MKAIVKPVGSFMYMTNEPGIAIVPERPVLVRVDEFIRTLKLQNKIEQVGSDTVVDQATDAEWKSWFTESGGWPKLDLSAESFIEKWEEGQSEESLAQQARETNERLAQEAREKAERDNAEAQRLLLEEAAKKEAAANEAAKALAASEKLAAEKGAAALKNEGK